MGDNIEDMDKKIQQKDNKMEFLDKKIGLPDSKVIQEMNRTRINKISSKKISVRIMHRLKNSLNNQNYIKNNK